MKYLLLSFLFLFGLTAYAKENKDVAQLLKESRCIPTRSKSGVVSYKCNGTLGAELQAQKKKPYPNQKSKMTTTMRQTQKFNRNRQPASIPVNTTSKVKPQETKIKACLASIYHNQINHFRTQGKFTTVSEDMGIDRNEKCNGLYIFTNVANEREFKITAQFGNAVWTVDQTRTIQKIR